MGQKTNPIGLRLGINRNWDSVWFDEKNYAAKLHEDIVLRNYINKRLPLYGWFKPCIVCETVTAKYLDYEYQNKNIIVPLCNICKVKNNDVIKAFINEHLEGIYFIENNICIIVPIND